MRHRLLLIASIVSVVLGVWADDASVVCGETAVFPFDTRKVAVSGLNSSLTVHYGGELLESESWATGSVHVVYGTVVVPTNMTLTVASGAVVKFVGGGIIANGPCIADGAVFTDIDDDAVGGDTLRNGTRVIYTSYVLSGDVRCSGYTQIRCLDALGAFTQEFASPRARFDTRGIGESGIGEAVSHAGGVMSADEKWEAGSVHVVYGTLTVPDGVTLTIEPGAVVKFVGGGLIVNGSCNAKGVTFTDVDDDSRGGDTRGNGDRAPFASFTLSGNLEMDDTTRIQCLSSACVGYRSNCASDVFYLNTATNLFHFAHQNELITFSTEWDESSSVHVTVTAPDGTTTILTNGMTVCHGVVNWSPTVGGTYVFRHETDTQTLEAMLYAFEEAVVHDGVLRGTNVWSADVVHVVNGGAFVPKDSLLAIESGAVVKFAKDSSLTIIGGGVCVAEGVVFTSLADDTIGGDSLCDGDATVPEENSYAIVGFVKDDLATEYRYGVQSYAGTLVGEVEWRNEKTYVIDGTLTVAAGATLTIPAGTVVKLTDGSSLKVAGGGVCVAEGAIFTHIADDSVGGDTMGDGDETKPEYGKYTVDVAVLDSDATEYRYSAPISTSGTISGNVVWRARQVYRVTGNLTLASGATLTIAPGSVVKFDPNVSLTVNSGATLNAQGTRSSPVVFTSVKDDAHGGDTNGDGGATTPNPGDWVKICVNGGTANFDYAKILYSSKNATTGAINMTSSGGKVVFANGEIAHAAYDAIGVESGNCHVTNSVIRDCLLAFRHWTRDPIVNCVIYDCGRLTQGGGQHFYNCIFSRIAETWEAFGFPQNGTTYNNCCFWNEGGSVLTGEGTQDALTVCGKDGNIWGDPLFIDPANGDFRIATNSPCVDAGDAAVAPEKDWYGQPRQGAAPDVGIYEALPRYVESDVDLSASNVAVADTWMIGGEENVSWQVENLGAAEASGVWRDKIELVSDGGERFTLAEPRSVLGLPAGARRPSKASVRVPAVPEGDYYVMVTVNHARDLFEGTFTENNAAISGTVRIRTETLDPANGSRGVLSAHGEDVLHFLLAPDSVSRLMVIRSDGDVTALFGAGRVPTESANIGLVSGKDGFLCFLVPSGVSDIYVRLGNNASDAVSYAVDFEPSALVVTGISNATVPYDGHATIQLTGAGFSSVADVKLRSSDGGDVTCGSWRSDSDSVLRMTVDGTVLVQNGSYHIVLSDLDGKETVPEYMLTVTSEPAKARAWARLVVPENVREGREHLCQIEYGNDGNADAIAPVLEVSFKGDGAFCLVGDDQQHEKLYFIGTGASGNAGVLLPGETRKIDFIYIAGNSPVETTAIILHKAEMPEIAEAATRLGRRGDDATSYASAKELAQLVSAGVTNGVYYGMVKDSNGEPVAEYLVAVTNGDSIVRALTDANGHYVTEPCRLDDMRIDFNVPALTTSSHVEVEGATEDTVVFAVNVDTWERIDGERMKHGKYVFRRIPDGSYAVWAYDVNCIAQANICVEDGFFGSINIILESFGSITGTFSGDGTEDAPAILLVGNGCERMSIISSDGSFSFSKLPSGDYTLLYLGDDFRDYTICKSLVVTAGENAFCSIAKTNNVQEASSTSQKVRRLASQKTTIPLSQVQHYLWLMDQNRPQPPPPDRACTHNLKLYRRDVAMFNAMWRILENASIRYTELEMVNRKINANMAGLVADLFGCGFQIAKESAWVASKLPELVRIANAGGRLGYTIGSILNIGDAEDASLEVANNIIGAEGTVTDIVDFAGEFSRLKGFRTALAKWLATYETSLRLALYKAGMSTQQLEASVATFKGVIKALGTIISLYQSYKKGKERYDLLQKQSELQSLLMADAVTTENNISVVLQNRSYPLCCNGDGEEDLADPPEDKKNTSKRKSKDPNEMLGPRGQGGRRFIKPGEELTYTIYFENVSNATAAAQEVYVTNPLSEWLDWSTFKMGEVAFNNQIDIGLSGRNGGSCEATMKGTNFLVRTMLGGGYDGEDAVATSGVAHWYLRIVDPTTCTGWPQDVLAGFLPPNDDAHRGEGHLTYRIKVREDAPANVVITNRASIVFDFNDPIETDPAWWNTVGSPGAEFAACDVEVDEGGMAEVRVSGGNADKASSVQVYLTYNTAAAADVDLAKGTVRRVEDNAPYQTNLKFPLMLSWAKGEIGEKVITIPVKTDKTVEDSEFFTLQLAAPQGMELGEERVCTVMIRDLNGKTLKAAVTPYKPKKGETVATNSVGVAIAAGGESGGFVAGTGEYTSRSKLTLTAEARPGWAFAGWRLKYGDGTILSDKAKWQVVVTNDVEYVAVFEKIPYVRGLADPADGGKVSGSGLCAAGKKVTLKATANKNFTFLGWRRVGDNAPYQDGEYVATTPSLVIDRSAKPAASSKTSTTITEVEGDATYYAMFKSDPEVFVSVDADEKGAEPTGKGAGKYVAGTITGMGKYAPGKKVTLKATANKGYVFSGWHDAAGVPLTKDATYTIALMGEADVEYTAKFITSDEDKGSIELKVDGVEMRRVEDNAPYQTNVWAGVYLEWPVAASARSATTVKVAGLPAGLKFADKPVTSKVGSGKAAVVVTNVPANTIYGAPTAASKTKTDRGTGAVTVTPSAVKVTVTTTGKSSQTYQIDTVVDALPAWAQGTFVGDQVSLTVSAAGKVSGKAQGDGLAYTLEAPYYSGFEATLVDEGLASNFLADVTASWSYKEGGKTIKTNDVVQLTVRDNGIGGRASVGDWFEAYTVNWKVEPWTTLGKKFDKKTQSYAILANGSVSDAEADATAALGAEVVGRVTLKFAASGTVTVSGEFTAYDEKTKKYKIVKASGSATLVPVDAEHGVVFIYLTPKGLAPHSRCLSVPWPEE